MKLLKCENYYKKGTLKIKISKQKDCSRYESIKGLKKIPKFSEKIKYLASPEFLNRRKLEVFEIKNEEYLCLK